VETIATNRTLMHPQHLDSFFIAPEKVSDRLAGDHAEIEYFAGLGEVNEVRGVFQRILSAQHGGPKRLDEIEILHTDYDQYVPLVLEQLTLWLADNGQDASTAPDLDTLPVTFAEGIACIYARPGRALRGWLRWARHQFAQTQAVQLIREGLLVRPDSAETIGYARLASSLRQVPIGFQSDRYIPKIREQIRSAEQSIQEYQQRGDREAEEGVVENRHRDFELSTLQAVLSMVQPLIDLAPSASDSAVTLLTKARNFLLGSARAENQLDRYARGKLLDHIDRLLATLKLGGDMDLDVLRWLEELPIASRIMASGPKPGCVHVAPLPRGGHSGRTQIFVVGLDDGRYPKRIAIDPVLLDTERKRLSENLQTSEDVSNHAGQSLDRALYRFSAEPGARIRLSYSVRNLADDRASYPSASMLELFRITEHDDDADMEKLLAHIGPPVAFVSEEPKDHLSLTDRQLAGLLAEPNHVHRQRWLEEHFEHARYQRVVSESQRSARLGDYDGLVPVAGSTLDPNVADRVSPSRLETYGACPRRFLFRYGLGIYPPDEWIVDRERWLDPLQLGNLVHDLFEQFLGKLTHQDLVPNFDRDRKPLLELLDAKIDHLKSDIPSPNQDAYRRTCDLLEEMCEIFLTKEEEYCRVHDARPWVMEGSIGLDDSDKQKTELDCREPIPLTLSDGRVIRVGGRLDRVDKLTVDGSERYAIWDYKSGSSYGFDQENPFNQGRKLQPFLYLGMLRHRLAAIGRDGDSVESFGYFFPSPRTGGLRLRWTRAQLRGGDDVLKNIGDLIAGGVFVPTTDASDCAYCDYTAACGDAAIVTERSLWKASQACNPVLGPFRELRDIELDASDVGLDGEVQS
jgi:RecB family exonuclease